MSKLNKYTLLGVFLVSGFVLSACVPTKNQEMEQTQTREQTQEEMQEMAKIIESGGSAYCKLTTDKEGEMLEYWIKGKKMKAKGLGFATGMAEEEKEMQRVGYMINDAQYTYMWSEGDKEGIKMKQPTEEELKEMAEDAQEWAEKMPDFTSDEVVAEYENQGYRVNCQKQNVSDSEFMVPVSVQFKDMSVMMEEATKMGEKMMEKFDEGDLEEMKRMGEEMQQKFGN